MLSPFIFGGSLDARGLTTWSWSYDRGAANTQFSQWCAATTCTGALSVDAWWLCLSRLPYTRLIRCGLIIPLLFFFPSLYLPHPPFKKDSNDKTYSNKKENYKLQNRTFLKIYILGFFVWSTFCSIFEFIFVQISRVRGGDVMNCDKTRSSVHISIPL